MRVRILPASSGTLDFGGRREKKKLKTRKVSGLKKFLEIIEETRHRICNVFVERDVHVYIWENI